MNYYNFKLIYTIPSINWFAWLTHIITGPSFGIFSYPTIVISLKNVLVTSLIWNIYEIDELLYLLLNRIPEKHPHKI